MVPEVILIIQLLMTVQAIQQQARQEVLMLFCAEQEQSARHAAEIHAVTAMQVFMNGFHHSAQKQRAAIRMIMTATQRQTDLIQTAVFRYHSQ
jgi:hypothetical protein